MDSPIVVTPIFRRVLQVKSNRARQILYIFSVGGQNPYLSVYTKPLGDGSDSGSWYRSRQTWKLAEANRLTLIPPNNKCLMYFGYQDPAVEIGIPHFLLVKDAGTSVGPQLPNEELLTIALSTVNSKSFTCNNFGTAIGGESINRTLSS
eukprot:Lithocolla_globosa_v1_NODE_11776_length_483_cov_206.518692.p1 type:complete len:149 gc:universal NODE_11776_length_483_cov_206.518692:481-35(-)